MTLDVSLGSQGVYVRMATGGVRYRAKIGNDLRRAQSPSTSTRQGERQGQGGADLSAGEVLMQMNQRLSEPAHFVAYSVAVAVAAALAGAVYWWLFPSICLALAYPLYLVRQDDQVRRVYFLHYTLSDDCQKQWTQLNEALEQLATCSALWTVDNKLRSADTRNNAGASCSVFRSMASLSRCDPTPIITNVTPYCLRLGLRRLYFLPDSIYVYCQGQYSTLSYREWERHSAPMPFVESLQLPADAVVQGYTWQHVNKDGSPNMRFTVNPRLPIAEYTEIRWSWSGASPIILLASRPDAAELLAQLWGGIGPETAGRRADGRRDSSRQGRQRTDRDDAAGNRESRRSHRTGESRGFASRSGDDQYRILGLSPSCTREQASEAYRQLAQKYHPDKVANLGVELQELAERKMKDINSAYSDIKSRRGW